MDILKHQFPIKSLIFLKSNCHAKMAPDILSGCESVNGSELSGACALFGPHRRVSERVAVALRRDAKLLLPHVARVSAAAGEQYRDLAVPRFEFKLGENRRNHRDQREESPFA